MARKHRTIEKSLNDHGNDGAGAPLEPDILECEVKWALAKLTTNKASGGDEVSLELIKLLKDGAVKVLHSMYQQIWKTHLWPQDWKRSVFISIQKKGNAKECSNYCKLVLAPLRLYSKDFKSGFNSPWTGNFQMYNLGIEEAEEPEIKLPTSLDHRKNKGVSEKHLLLFHWLC